MSNVERAQELKAALVRDLKARFPDTPFFLTESPDWELKVMAPNPYLGFVAVTADHEEATICLGELTHSHFNPYDDKLSGEAHVKWVSGAVVSFLECLFEDRVVVWTTGFGRGGGWQIIEPGAVPELPEGSTAQLWSRPLVPRH